MSEEEKSREESVRFQASFKGKRHGHIWGYELWIENNEKYCSKLLILNEGFESSWHYHERKDETFIILEGRISLTYENEISTTQTIILREGEKFRLKPKV